MTLGNTHLGTALNVQVIAILRDGQQRLAPEGDTALRGGDILLVEGQLPDLHELLRLQGVEVQRTGAGDLPRPTKGVSGIRARLTSESRFAGRSLRELRFRERFGAVVVAIQRSQELLEDELAGEILQEEDEIIALGTRPQLEELASHPDLVVVQMGLSAVHQLQDHLFLIRIREGSRLAGLTVGASRMGELFGVTVGGIIRGSETRLGSLPTKSSRWTTVS